METIVRHDYGELKLDLPAEDEAVFYEGLAKRVTALPFPNDVLVETPIGSIRYDLSERGGTLNCQEKQNCVRLPRGTFPKKYLTYADFISAEKKALLEKGLEKSGRDFGSYKFYSLEEEGNKIKATWGAIGGNTAGRSCLYDPSMFWLKYYEKIQKGYHDKTSVYVEDDAEEQAEEPVKNVVQKPKNEWADRLFATLTKFSRLAVKKSIRATKVTKAMVKESKRVLAKLYETKDLDEFNQLVLELMEVCPRRSVDTKHFQASSVEDMRKILQREEDLVQAMEGLLLSQGKTSDEAEPMTKNPLTDLGINVLPASKDQEAKIKDLLPMELRSKVVNIYRVDCEAHRKRFLKYLADNHLDKKDIRTFWHGSRNENWLSIIENGLLLNPNAVITGKMFGNGIYFAPSAQKSWGYTSYAGSYWAGGSSNKAFMGLYQTAYGKPYHPDCAKSYTKEFLKRNGKNCVHALRNYGNSSSNYRLRNDEVVFYDEAAMYLSYIVEFG
jgi:poly [ADP-ribose] polymerase